MTDKSELIRRCLDERKSFATTGESYSPACVELFRLAFAGDEVAWEAIFAEVFRREVYSFVVAAARVRRFSPEDIEDAIQKTRLAFWHYAPKTATLAKVDDLAPLIAYLKKCAMSAVALVARKLPPDSYALNEIRGEEADDSSDGGQTTKRSALLPNRPSFSDEYDRLSTLIEGVRKLLHTDLERLVAEEVFLNDTPPRELILDYPDRFEGNTSEAKLKHANQVLQTLRRRLKQSPVFTDLQSPRRKSDKAAFLQFSVGDESDVNEAKMPAYEPCPYDEITLLDYVRGVTSYEIKLAIERSPACMAAARTLAEDMQVLTPMLRLAICPDVDKLIEYHEKRLPGAKQLVIHNHVQRCRQCQEELAMFTAIDEVPLQNGPSFFRRVIEAFFLLPTLSAAPVRGTLPSIHYRTQIRTPAIDIFIFTQKQTGKTRTWTLRGELRTEEGLLFTEVEKIVLHGSDLSDIDQKFELSTTLEEEGMFVFRGLETGDYSLHILTNDEEILVRSIKVGSEH